MSVSTRPLAALVAAVAVGVVGVAAFSGDDQPASTLRAGTESNRVATTTTVSSSTSVVTTSSTVAPAAASVVATEPVQAAAEAPAVTAAPDVTLAAAAAAAPAVTAASQDGVAVEAAGVADPKCAPDGNSALVDRKKQRAYLCTDGRRGEAMVMTSAWSMPDPATYKVYAKDLKATSTFGGHFSRMTHFVAFSYGERTGARVAFHSLPTLNNGEYVQPLDSVGDLGRRGESNGCIRVLPDDAVRIWDHLQIGDEVIVLN